MSRTLHDIHVAARQITARHTTNERWSVEDAAALVLLSTAATQDANPRETLAAFAEHVNLPAPTISAWRAGRTCSYKPWPALQERLATVSAAIAPPPSDLPALDTAPPSAPEWAAAACAVAGWGPYTWQLGTTNLTVYGPPIAVDLVQTMVAKRDDDRAILASANAEISRLSREVSDGKIREGIYQRDIAELRKVAAGQGERLKGEQAARNEACGESASLRRVVDTWKTAHDTVERSMRDLQAELAAAREERDRARRQEQNAREAMNRWHGQALAADKVLGDLGRAMGLERFSAMSDYHREICGLAQEYVQALRDVRKSMVGALLGKADVTLSARIVPSETASELSTYIGGHVGIVRAIYGALNRPLPQPGSKAAADPVRQACEYIRGLRLVDGLAGTALMQTADVLGCQPESIVGASAAARSKAERLSELLDAECKVSCDLVFAVLADDHEQAIKLAQDAMRRFMPDAGRPRRFPGSDHLSKHLADKLGADTHSAAPVQADPGRSLPDVRR